MCNSDRDRFQDVQSAVQRVTTGDPIVSHLSHLHLRYEPTPAFPTRTERMFIMAAVDQSRQDKYSDHVLCSIRAYPVHMKHDVI